jgi:hydrogenase maturation protein HypF
MAISGSVSPDTVRVRRCTITIPGVVQGIGFRPLVYRMAMRHGLAGSVRNCLQGALVELEGDEVALERLLDQLQASAPNADGYARCLVTWDEPRGVSTFAIEESVRNGTASLHPVPDLGVCEACLGELIDPRDRRRGYPLLTCTGCGPRFTIVHSLPYDRERTTMTAFSMCPACRREYEDPGDRRFHAENIACGDCGPRVGLRGPDGAVVAEPDPIGRTADVLRAGGVVAIKGVGGYHLACDARNGEAVTALRRRKRREAKPLAVMVADVLEARALCHVSDTEARLLASAARPIVLLATRAGAGIAGEVAPGGRELGVILPYTPLHHLLLAAVGMPLVMTSGNASDEPIAHRDADALTRLQGAVDLFLTHDRPIEVACDDSVARVVSGTPRLVRRSRGYVPLAVRLPVTVPRPVLACGGELKSTFALVRDGEAFLSHHLGDLTSEAAFRGFVEAVGHFRRLFDLTPEIVAHDLHPAYRSTIYAQSLEGVERVAVQHHHAHIASCLADNGVDRLVIGVAWDGSGYGADGHVWGGEFLLADLAGFERVGHFEPVRMPGGDAAVREPWRMAAVFLRAGYGDAMANLDLAFMRRLDPVAWRVLSRAADRGLNSPLTSSAGRLFDAVASLLGLRDRVGFEAQAAMELEALADREADIVYPTALAAGETVVVRTTDVVRGVVDDLLREVPAAQIAARFHATLADVLLRVCERLRERTGIAAVALSGGVFQNAWLLKAAIERLDARGFEVYSHRQVPTNDGGLSLGQAAVAARRLATRGDT